MATLRRAAPSMEMCCGCGGLPRNRMQRRQQRSCAAGNFFWNSGMFLWSARTLANALREHLPNTARLLEEIAAAYGTRKFAATFRELYPKCENISVDYAVLEPRSAKGEQGGNIFCLPADFGWNDLGSWTALHEHHTAKSAPARREFNQRHEYVRTQCEGKLRARTWQICGGSGREQSGCS